MVIESMPFIFDLETPKYKVDKTVLRKIYALLLKQVHLTKLSITIKKCSLNFKLTSIFDLELSKSIWFVGLENNIIFTMSCLGSNLFWPLTFIFDLNITVLRSPEMFTEINLQLMKKESDQKHNILLRRWVSDGSPLGSCTFGCSL